MLAATMNKTGAVMPKILFLFAVLGISSAAFTQTKQESWVTLNGLRPGQNIQVIETTSKKRSGTFLTVSDTAISYRDATGERSIQRQDVRSVKLQSNHRLRNTLIFAGIGAGAGAGIGAASVQQTGSIILSVSRGKGAAVGAVIGVVAGAAVGSLLPAHSTIYSASSH
jgi:hypothetical protein